MSPRYVDPEILQERENILLDQALLLLQQQGVEGLTMDKLVKQVPFSKGTVYGHFSGKEDLLLGLCNRGMGIMCSLFARAAAFEGSSRDRMLAIHFAYLLYSRLYPMMFMLVITAKSPGITEKASEKQRAAHLQLEARLSGSIITTIEQGLSGQECMNPGNLSIEQIAFANWSAAFGSIALLSKDIEQCGVRAQLQSDQALITNISLLLDGLQWRPLMSEFDYSLTLERLKTGLFAAEMEELNAREEMTDPG
ncbi:TetR/AcrR family transcriptional regulator [Amphritea sp. HPY]|uniref:TetR/AcrR family transcriptional regulator n=1 Tax=Amphritea sp. HPY TaxID=3421652 RepID=UPI003D7CFBAE